MALFGSRWGRGETLALSPGDDSQRSARKLARLRAQYAVRLPGVLDGLHALLCQLLDEWQSERAREVRDQLHRLVGSSGTYGFAQVSIEARKLELEVARWLDQAPGQAARGQLESLWRRLAHAAPQPPQALVLTRGRARVEQQASSDLVLFHGAAPADFEALAGVLAEAGYRLQEFSVAPLQASEEVAPVARVVRLADAAALQQTLADTPDRPLVVLAPKDDFSSRLLAVRSGSNAFLTEPIDAESLVESLDRLTAHQGEQAFRVLMVDDDLAAGEHNALLLRSTGMRVELATEPEKALAALVELQPDLVLMDLYMPGCNGLDLAAVIHQKASFVSLPIVFLSAESDPDLQFGDMLRDGDDVLTKQIPADHLISAVTHHARRSRLLQSMMTRDGLTGLIGHSLLLERLDQEISRARRRSVPVAFAMVDLDDFKAVNDTHGHAAGDRLLRGFARFIERTLRRSDSVGRYGGDEFGIVLPGVDAAGAQRILDRARQRFVDQPPVAVGQGAGVSFSCGVADFPGQGNARDLTASADRALYRAKGAGRNRVVVALESC